MSFSDNTIKTTSQSRKDKHFFLNSPKQVLQDFIFFSITNILTLYVILFLIPDSSVAMISVVWVGIIAWREGAWAGLIASFFATFFNYIGLNLPPHSPETVPLRLYFNNKVPGALLGLTQTLITGVIVGYISNLVHALRDEIDLRKKTQLQLQQKIAELDAFGHTVAHDLKNPLTVVKVSIECLVKELKHYQDLKVVQKLTFINESTQHMVAIIESILLLAGINRTKQAESALFPMQESVENALQRLKYAIESNDVTIIKPESWPKIFAYAPWITEVWVNYINNAIKYGGIPEKNIKPVIKLGFDYQTSNDPASMVVRFWVKDNGAGIESNEMPKLFKEFTRLHSGNTGHGLGLSIIKSIITKSNGDVGVESEIGKGSLFYFTLPLPKNYSNTVV